MDMQNLQAVINAVKKVIPLREAYLFGSYAYGVPNKDSDYDLYFVADKIDARKHDVIVSIYDVIDDIRKKPIDVLLNTKEHFDSRKDYRGTIEYKVVKEGVRLYEQRNV